MRQQLRRSPDDGHVAVEAVAVHDAVGATTRLPPTPAAEVPTDRRRCHRKVQACFSLEVKYESQNSSLMARRPVDRRGPMDGSLRIAMPMDLEFFDGKII